MPGTHRRTRQTWWCTHGAHNGVKEPDRYVGCTGGEGAMTQKGRWSASAEHGQVT